MGCDIHMYVERKVDGKWVFANPPKPTFEEIEDEDYEGLGWYWRWAEGKNPLVKWDLGRSYSLFTILADVRNDSPLNKPIKGPVGVPKDACAEILAKYELDAHTPSHYTLKELLDHDWETLFFEVGVVTLEDAIKIKETGSASHLNGWCGWVSGPGIVVLPWNEAVNERRQYILAALGHPEPKPLAYAEKATPEQLRAWGKNIENPRVQMVWSAPQSECVKYIIDEFIPALKELGEPENVRCVFWFDN